MQKPPLLVTGGAGFIGSALVRRLIAAGERVVTVDALTYAGNLDSLAEVADVTEVADAEVTEVVDVADPERSKQHVFEHVDICDAAALARILDRHRPRAILHLAAESHVDRSIDGPDAFIQTNLVGTFRLLQAARGYHDALPQPERERFRFVHVSTDEVFGSLDDDAARFDERTSYDPRSPYSASKAGSDHLARAWHHTYGLPVVVTNCSNNYGPYQFPEKLIPLMILNALDGRPLPVYGDGANVRDWIFVDDHADGLIAALEHGEPGGTYLFGGDAERRNIDVVRTLCALLDELRPRAESHEALITFVTDRPGHDFRYAIDSGHAQKALGWQPRHSFEDGLRATVEWYLANDEWCARVRSGAYRGERLGLAVSS